MSACSSNGGPVSSVAGHEEDSVPLTEPGSAASSAVGVDDDDGDGSAKVYHNVWELERVLKTGSNKANGGWKCLWCNNIFKGWNATKVLRHLAKIPGRDIRPCRARIDDDSLILYRNLNERKEGRTKEFKDGAPILDKSVVQGQMSMAIMFEQGRKRKSSSGGNKQHDSTIEASCATQLTMAIADFVHSSGLSFSATQGAYFKRMLHLARGVPSAYTPPSRNAISTSLLRLNYSRRLQRYVFLFVLFSFMDLLTNHFHFCISILIAGTKKPYSKMPMCLAMPCLVMERLSRECHSSTYWFRPRMSPVLSSTLSTAAST
jgi:hypothetical protein